MPFTNFPFYICTPSYLVPEEHKDYSVLSFKTGDSAFIVIAKSNDINRLTELAARISNQTGLAWSGNALCAWQHNLAVETALKWAAQDLKRAL